MGQVTGRVFVRVKGKMMRSKEGAKLDFGGVERVDVATADGTIHYAEKPVPAVVTCTVADTNDLDILDLAGLTGVAVEFETDTGKTYLVSNAFCAKPPVLTGGEGDLELEFHGQAAKKA